MSTSMTDQLQPSANTTPLGEKMRALAEHHERGDELRQKAAAFEDAVAGYYAEPQTITAKQFLGHFARARICWCECSGESLV
jgi:hypothetical protein